MKLANLTAKVQGMKFNAVKVLAAATLAGGLLVAPAAQAQQFGVGVQFGAPGYYAPAAPVVAYGGYGYNAPVVYGNAYGYGDGDGDGWRNRVAYYGYGGYGDDRRGWGGDDRRGWGGDDHRGWGGDDHRDGGWGRR